ncbi:6197_t:CDS:2, partial [Acaulospora morrowiae]
CYGITHIPERQQYGIVLPLASEGDLRKYMRNYFPLGWKLRLRILQGIINGLKGIHDLNFVHANLHPGNVVINVDMGETKAYLIDFGMSRRSGASSQEVDKNMPFMAPEIIKGQGYTKAGDIYSFSMLMYKISSGNSPFKHRSSDVHLALDICNGLRPPLDRETPKCYADLMSRCWDTDSLKRPTIKELKKYIDSWYNNERSTFS